MLSFVERCQSVLAGVILALLIASVVLVPQNRALADEGHGGGIGQGTTCSASACDAGCYSCTVKFGIITGDPYCDPPPTPVPPPACVCINGTSDCNKCACKPVKSPFTNLWSCVCKLP